MKDSQTLETGLAPVVPAKPLAGYIGGKRNLSRRVIDRLNRIPHGLYAEPFVGMGGIFFRRTVRPASEVINDISADVTNLFRLLQRHYQQFLDVLKWQISSRAEFERLLKIDPETLTDLERAARFLYLQRLTFGGKVVGRSFGVQTTQGAGFNLTKLVPMLEDVHERLAGVVIERLPWAELIQRYDRPHTLFYLDPPYFGSETDYGAGVFSVDDFDRMSKLLRQLQGRFLLSINDTPEVRSVFGWASIEPVETTYSIQGGGRSNRAGELIITAPS
jgi:DNA adenine methylase